MWIALLALVAATDPDLPPPPLVEAPVSVPRQAPAPLRPARPPERELRLSPPPLLDFDAAPHVRARAPEQPLLSRNIAGRTARLLLTSTAGNFGAVGGSLLFGALGFAVGAGVGGCSVSWTGPAEYGCLAGALLGIAVGQPLGLGVGVHLSGKILGTRTGGLTTALGVVLGEATLLGGLALVGHLRPQYGSELDVAAIALLFAPALVTALVHELGDATASPSESRGLKLAVMPVRGGAGVAAGMAF